MQNKSDNLTRATIEVRSTFVLKRLFGMVWGTPQPQNSSETIGYFFAYIFVVYLREPCDFSSGGSFFFFFNQHFGVKKDMS